MGEVSDFFREVDFASFIWDLQAGGWFDYVFPFLLVYAVVFTILNRVDIFADKKPVKVIIALIFAIFSISFPISDTCGNAAYSVSSGCTLGDLLMVLFPGVTAFSMGILALYIVAAMLGVDLIEFLGNKDGEKNIIKYVLGGLGVLVVGYYYGKGFGIWDQWTDNWLFDILSDPLLYILIIFGLIFWWITKDDDGKKRSSNSHSNSHGGDHH